MKTWFVILCGLLVAILVLPAAGQVQIGPDLIPPTPVIPPPPPGATAPVSQHQTTVAAAAVAPGPHKAGEAQLYGAVTDPSGAVLSGATITVTSSAGTQTATSDEKGQYHVNVAPGTYKFSIAIKGFKEFQTENLALNADQELEMDGALEPAAAGREEVNVVGNTVGQVETEKAEVSGTITSTEIANTPLNGRNFTSLLTLAPGVSNQSGQDEALVGVKGSVKFSVNGGRVEYNTFSVDGSDVLHAGIHGSESTLVVYPSLDAISELKVLTSNYGAQYGRSASGTILVDTKSGASSLHGTGYYFGRNEIFNARNYFDQTIKAPVYRKHDLGFTIGGPVTIPKIYPKNRTFFFFSEEARLEKDPTDNNFNQAVPSAAERPTVRVNKDGSQYVGADFSDVCPELNGNDTVAFNPAQFPDCPQASNNGNGTFSTYPHNIVGYRDSQFQLSPLIDPTAAAVMNSGMVPLPNATAGCNSTTGSCYDFAFAQPTYWRQELIRVDHDIQPNKLRATFRYIHDSWDTTEARPIWGYVRNSFPTVQGRLFGPGTSGVAKLTHTISPSLLNEVVFSYTASHISLATRTAPGVNIIRPDGLDQGYLFNNCFGGTLGSDGTCSGGKLSGVQLAPGNLAYGGGFRVDPGYAPWQLTNPTFSIRDDLSKVIGKHTVSMGIQLIRGQRDEINATNGPNTGDLQGLLGFDSFNQPSTGNEYANLLIGYIHTFQQDSQQQKYYNRYDIIEPYVQDDWKVNSRLTLNLGVRFSLFGNYHELNHAVWNWDPSAYVTPTDLSLFPDGRLRVGNKAIQIDPADPNFGLLFNGLVQCGVGGVPETCQKPHRFNPAPRIGFAWSPGGDAKTSIRGGYGVFFEHGTGSEANTGSLVGSAPVNMTMTQLTPSALADPSQKSTYPCIGGIGGKDFGCTSGTGAYPIDVTSIPRKAIWPYVQQWSFGIQRELSHSLIVGVTYVGSKGTHLTAVRQPNAFPLGPQGFDDGIQLDQNPYGPHQPLLQSNALGTFDCANHGTFKNPVFTVNGIDINKTQPIFINMLAACQVFGFNGTNSPSSLPSINQYRPYFGLQKIFSLENIADSNYHAFQTTLRHTRGPLTFDVSYSFSHSIDDSSDRNDTTIVNPVSVAGNKASSNFDQRHLLNVSYTWTLPKFKIDTGRLGDWANDREASETPRAPGFFDRAVNGLLEGWQISGVTTVQSGTPYSVINGGFGALGISVPDNAGVAGGISSVASFPDIVGNIHGSHPLGSDNSRSFGPALGNAAAFAAPRGLTFGNAGRNVLNNPARWNFDMTLSRSVKVHESTSMEFRAEVFNVLNHTQFRVYDPSPNFGNGATNTVSCYGVENFSAAGDPETNCLLGNAFLHPVNAHRPRTMQFGLKVNF